MFDPGQIYTKLLIEAVPYLSMIEMQDYDWDDLGKLLNLNVQGAGPRAAGNISPDSLNYSNLRWQPHWSSVKAEVFTLLCTDDEKYLGLRDRLSKHSGTATLYILSTISVWVSSHIGASLAMITPLVGTTLYAVAKLGVGGWCRHERRHGKRSKRRNFHLRAQRNAFRCRDAPQQSGIHS
jgi:hypothetical protein